LAERLGRGIDKHRIVQKLLVLASEPSEQQLEAIKVCLTFGLGKPPVQMQIASAERQEITVRYVGVDGRQQEEPTSTEPKLLTGPDE
jgi:hypothetical protein